MKEGSIIFLTRRKKGNLIRRFVSGGIAVFTKREDQALDNVLVHSAIIYRSGSELYVREMEKNGDEHKTLVEYNKIYGKRMYIKVNPFDIESNKVEKFNLSCETVRVKYDYWNTFFFQIIKVLFGRFLGKKTTLHRMCAEDAQRQFNLLKDIFKTPEKTSPNDLWYMICDWKITEFNNFI